VGRIGLVQVFDYHKGYMPPGLIAQNGRRFDAVWASLSPTAWASAHPGMVVSSYFIMGMDQYVETHHTLSWWQANHPDWILYACTANGSPTHDIAYMAGVDIPDMPLDIHNPDVVSYQINTMAEIAHAAGYNALAIDQVVFWNIYHGGNKAFHQQRNTTEYACGSWHGSSFQRHYASPQDPQYPADVVAYVREARQILHARNMALVINHPGGSTNDPNEQQLLANTDAVMNETGFSDYGNYQQHPGIVAGTLAWMRYAQAHGTAVFVVNKFIHDTGSNGAITPAQLDYAMATYLLGNQGAALLFAGGLHGYGTQQLHSEYNAAIGTPCSDLAGGPSVFTRRFSGGMAIVNASLSTTTLALPAHAYRDIHGRSIGRSISLAPMSGYVLLTADNGCA
jgi:hypothetical protein